MQEPFKASLSTLVFFILFTVVICFEGINPNYEFDEHV